MKQITLIICLITFFGFAEGFTTNTTFDPTVQYSEDNLSTQNIRIFINGQLNGVLSCVIGGIGVFLNFYVLTIMFVANVAMNEAAMVLLRFQLFVDGVACIFLIIGQFGWPKYADMPTAYRVSCVGLDRNGFLWVWYVASAYNIVAVAAQRFVITVFPFTQVTKKHSYIILVFVFLIGIAINCLNYGLEMDIQPEKDICVYTYKSWAANISWVVLFYFFPTFLIIGFYAKVILALRARGDVQSTSTKKSETKVIKNAIVIATMFIIFAAPNTWTYFLMPLNMIDNHVWETFLRLFTYLCTMFNSASTPIVYIIFLSSIRAKSVEVLRKLCYKATVPTASLTDTTTISSK